MEKKKSCVICCSKGFPTFPVLLLVLGMLWFLSELNLITVDIPWWPVILMVIAIGWLVNHYSKK